MTEENILILTFYDRVLGMCDLATGLGVNDASGKIVQIAK